MNQDSCQELVDSVGAPVSFGGSASVAVSTGSLEATRSSVSGSAQALVVAHTEALRARWQIAPDWHDAVASAQQRRERILAQGVSAMEATPSSWQLSRYNQICDRLRSLEVRLNHCVGELEHLEVVARTAAIEYAAAERLSATAFSPLNLWATLSRFGLRLAGSHFSQGVLLGTAPPIKGGHSPCDILLAAHTLRTQDPRFQFNFVERIQQGTVLLRNQKVREMLARALEQGLKIAKAPAYSAYTDPEKGLVRKPVDARPQSTVPQVMAAFAAQNSETRGAVQITKFVRGNVPHYVVSIPGTVNWETGGMRHPLDLSSNFDTLFELDSTGTRYVENAMKQAGVQPGAQVVLIGHSQGGMIASALGARTDFTDLYHVRGIVTMNSPTSTIPVKAGIPALHVENRRDLVPAIDLAPMPVSVDRIQLVGIPEDSGASSNHDAKTAINIVEQAQQDPAVMEVSARIEEFLPQEGEHAETAVYDINKN